MGMSIVTISTKSTHLETFAWLCAQELLKIDARSMGSYFTQPSVVGFVHDLPSAHGVDLVK